MADKYIKGERGIRTIDNLIKAAFEPVGKVMYIYGGGWNEADTCGGIETMTLGLSPKWLDFSAKQNSSYNYKDYDYKKDISVIHYGLDCSAYVGWVIYNVFNDGRNYVTNSYKMGQLLSSLDYGFVIDKNNIKEIKKGDIMFSNCNDCKHIYIALKSYSDGSVLLLHSSPPGVQLSGTYTPNGNKNSQAIDFATKYMKKYYPSWYNRFPHNGRDERYLSHYDCFRWSIIKWNAFLFW